MPAQRVPTRATVGEVPRPRLVRLVTATEPGATCFVVAAPGYGASTLLRQLAASTPDPVVRLRLGRDDDLWAPLGSALEISSDGTAATYKAITARLDDAGPVWILVDTVEDTVAGARLERDLGVLASGLGANARLAVAAHAALRWEPTTAARMIEIDETPLAFTLDEAVELLPHLEAGQLESTWELTGGWPAALRAVATQDAVGGPSGTDWLIGAGADRLLGAWFGRLPRPQQEFLLETALLDELDVGACNAVRRRDDSAAALSELVRTHRLVWECDGSEPPRWRRHPMLTAFVRRHAEPDRIRAERHSRAADWFASHGDVPATMHHLLGAGRTAEAGAFLRRHEASLFMSGRGRTAVDWFDQLPDEEHGARSLRLLRVAWGEVLSGDIASGEVWLDRVKSLGPLPQTEPLQLRLALEGEVGVLEAYLAAFRGDAVTMAEAGQRAIAAFGGAVDRDAEQMAYVLRIKGLQWSGDHERAALLLDSLADRPFPNDMIREASLAGLHAHRLRFEGRIHEAYRVSERAVRWLDDHGLEPAGERQLRGRGEWAMTLLELGDLAGAATALDQAAEACSRNSRHAEHAVLLVAMARLQRASHDHGAALRSLQQARRLLLAHAPGTPLLHLVDDAEARVRIDTGDLERAERLIWRLPPNEERQLLGARALLARGADPRPALSGVSTATPRRAAETHLLLAWAGLERSTRVAESHLQRAVDVAADTGQALLLLDAPPKLVEFADTPRRRVGNEELARLLDTTRPRTATDPPAPHGRPSLLSPGEQDLLPLLPIRETVAGIGRILGVSENTVKTRLQRLYRKLGASNRDQAIAIARSRSLL